MDECNITVHKHRHCERFQIRHFGGSHVLVCCLIASSPSVIASEMLSSQPYQSQVVPLFSGCVAPLRGGAVPSWCVLAIIFDAFVTVVACSDASAFQTLALLQLLVSRHVWTIGVFASPCHSLEHVPFDRVVFVLTDELWQSMCGV